MLTLERVAGNYQCEANLCSETQGLTMSRWSDEDGDPYYDVLCPTHRAEQENTSRCCGEEVVLGYCNGCGEHA